MKKKPNPAGSFTVHATPAQAAAHEAGARQLSIYLRAQEIERDHGSACRELLVSVVNAVALIVDASRVRLDDIETKRREAMAELTAEGR